MIFKKKEEEERKKTSSSRIHRAHTTCWRPAALPVPSQDSRDTDPCMLTHAPTQALPQQVVSTVELPDLVCFKLCLPTAWAAAFLSSLSSSLFLSLSHLGPAALALSPPKSPVFTSRSGDELRSFQTPWNYTCKCVYENNRHWTRWPCHSPQVD